MDNRPYISRIMSFITNMQYHKESGSESQPEPGPEPEPSEWVVWDRTYKHRLDAMELNYDENVSWLPEASSLSFLNLYHLDGSIITDESDFNNAFNNTNDAVIGTLSEEMEGQLIKSCVFMLDESAESSIPLYVSDPSIFDSPAKFDLVCTNNYSQIGDLSAVALPSSKFIGGHVDMVNGLFYYNLVSEQNMTKEGVEYQNLLVHDLRAYEVWRKLDKTLPDNKTGLFKQGSTSDYTNGKVFGEELETGGYRWNIGVTTLQPVIGGSQTSAFEVFPSPEDANRKLAFNTGEMGSGSSDAIKNGYIELVGSQLFAYYNELPAIGG